MYNVLLTIDVILALFLCGMVMLQRSEGGALGGLGGGTGSSFMTGRSVGNALSKATAITAGLFFACSLALAVLAKKSTKDAVNLLDTLPEQTQSTEVPEKPALFEDNAANEQPAAEEQPAQAE